MAGRNFWRRHCLYFAYELTPEPSSLVKDNFMRKADNDALAKKYASMKNHGCCFRPTGFLGKSLQQVKTHI